MNLPSIKLSRDQTAALLVNVAFGVGYIPKIEPEEKVACRKLFNLWPALKREPHFSQLMSYCFPPRKKKKKHVQ